MHTLERMEGSESTIEARAFIALVLMRTSGSLRTLMSCETATLFSNTI